MNTSPKIAKKTSKKQITVTSGVKLPNLSVPIIKYGDYGYIQDSTGRLFKIAFKEITPTYAKSLLNKNSINNRNKSSKVVKSYAKKMKDGLWGLSTDPIAFDDNNKLIQGQHRLDGVIESDTTQEFFMMWGFSKDTIYVIDDLKKRNGGDSVSMVDYKLPNGVNTRCTDAPLTSMSIKYAENIKKAYKSNNILQYHLGKNWEYMNLDIKNIFEKNPHFYDYPHSFALDWFKALNYGFSKANFVGYFYYKAETQMILTNNANAIGTVKDFMDVLCYNSVYPTITKFRNRITNRKIKSSPLHMFKYNEFVYVMNYLYDLYDKGKLSKVKQFPISDDILNKFN
jgi:hypothetical protein